MSSAYFKVQTDMTIEGRWFLGSPLDSNGKEVDPRKFTLGVKVSVDPPLRIPIRREGEPLNFTLADFMMPVADDRIGRLFSRHAGQAVQLIPAVVDSQSGNYSIVNVIETYKCIDEERSQFMRWMERDGIPKKVGLYRSFTKLVLNQARIGPAPIFRIADWETALVIRRELKGILEEHLVAGVTFSPLDA